MLVAGGHVYVIADEKIVISLDTSFTATTESTVAKLTADAGVIELAGKAEAGIKGDATVYAKDYGYVTVRAHPRHLRPGQGRPGGRHQGHQLRRRPTSRAPTPRSTTLSAADTLDEVIVEATLGSKLLLLAAVPVNDDGVAFGVNLKVAHLLMYQTVDAHVTGATIRALEEIVVKATHGADVALLAHARVLDRNNWGVSAAAAFTYAEIQNKIKAYVENANLEVEGARRALQLADGGRRGRGHDPHWAPGTTSTPATPSATAATAPPVGGLTNGATYFVRKVGTDKVRLYATASDATSRPPTHRPHRRPPPGPSHFLRRVGDELFVVADSRLNIDSQAVGQTSGGSLPPLALSGSASVLYLGKLGIPEIGPLHPVFRDLPQAPRHRGGQQGRRLHQDLHRHRAQRDGPRQVGPGAQPAGQRPRRRRAPSRSGRWVRSPTSAPT